MWTATFMEVSFLVIQKKKKNTQNNPNALQLVVYRVGSIQTVKYYSTTQMKLGYKTVMKRVSLKIIPFI